VDHSAFLNAILDAVHNLVVVLDGKGRILRFNRLWEQGAGYNALEVVSCCSWDIFLAAREQSAVRDEFAHLRDSASGTNQTRKFESYWAAQNSSLRHIAWQSIVWRGIGGWTIII
jgi:two-component system NtrC family sensor kinase